MSALQILALAAGAVSTVSAHGYVSGIVIGSKWYSGYNPSFSYQDPPPKVIGWTASNNDLGFVAPSAYTTPDIICHIDGAPGQASASVAAGGKVELQWTEWPESHHGPVLDYLAKCSGKCEDAKKESLEFFKIDEGGLVDPSTPPGTWASDQLIAANNSWTVTIPSSIAPGNYVLRHEIIALHSAGTADGAQNYPQCINLVVTGGGSDSPAGESAEKFYTPQDKGILVDIYNGLTKYVIPGPPVYGGGSGSPAPSSAASAPSSSAAPASSAAPSSAPAQSGGASYSAPAGASSSAAAVSSSAVASSYGYSAPAASSSAAAVSSSAVASSYGYSAPAASSSAAAVSSSAAASSVYASSSFAASSSKCTTRITISSSAAASSVYASSSAGAVSSSAVYPVGSASSYPAPSSITAPISSGFPAPSGTAPWSGYPAPSSAPSSFSYSVPAPSSSYAAPSASASAPATYPAGTAPPPTGGDVDMDSLMAKIIAMIKQMFRKAEHGRDFKRRV